MNDLFTVWALALFFFLLYLAVHIMQFRRVRPKNRFRFLKRLFLAFLPMVLLSSYAITARHNGSMLNSDFEAVIYFVHSIFLTGFLFIGYCMFYGIVDRSVSVRISIKLIPRKDKPISLGDLVGLYDPAETTARRFRMMLEGGYLIRTGDQYTLTAKGKKTAQRVRFLKRALRLGVGG